VTRILTTRNEGKLRFPLILSGPAGVGKTYMAAMLYRIWPHFSGHYEPEFWRAGELCRYLTDAEYGRPRSLHRAGGTSVEATADKIEDICRRSDLLVLDDIGNVSPSPQGVKALLDILDWSARRPVIVTTNLSEDQIEKFYGGPATSRLFAGRTVAWAANAVDRRSE